MSSRRNPEAGRKILRRDVLRTVLLSSGGSPKGVIMKYICREVLPRGLRDTKTGRQAVKELLHEAVNLGILARDSRRRYTLDEDVSRHVTPSRKKLSDGKKRASRKTERSRRQRRPGISDDASVDSDCFVRDAEEMFGKVWKVYQQDPGSPSDAHFEEGTSANQDAEEDYFFDRPSTQDEVPEPTDSAYPLVMSSADDCLEQFDPDGNEMEFLDTEAGLQTLGDGATSVKYEVVDPKNVEVFNLDSSDSSKVRAPYAVSVGGDFGIQADDKGTRSLMKVQSLQNFEESPARDIYS